MKVQVKETNYKALLIIYCLGLLIGGLFVGMVAPVRTVIQTDLGLMTVQESG